MQDRAREYDDIQIYLITIVNIEETTLQTNCEADLKAYAKWKGKEGARQSFSASPVGFDTSEGHEEGIYCMAMFPQGDKIITGSWNPAAIIWDCSTMAALHVLRGHRIWLGGGAGGVNTSV